MQCRDCGYDLWNLTEPRCPECGSGFDLRTYRFTPDTVAFACPDCGTLHQGRGDRYLPAASDEATCQGCGTTMQVTHMRVVPLVPDPPAAIGSVMPWDDREKLGWWKAWWGTTWMAMTDPAELVRRSAPGSPFGRSYLYAFLTYLVGLSVNLILIVGLMMLFFGFAVAGSTSTIDAVVWLLPVMGMMGGLTVGYALAAPLLMTILIAVPAQLFLRLFAPERKGGMGDTACFVNYAQAPLVLMAIPLCGYHIGSSIGYVWMVVVAILMIGKVHQVSGTKATVAVLWLPVLLLLFYLGVVAALFVMQGVQP